ncbi:MAG: MFS transporter [Cellvibrionales bacterium]|nr:MFS transporter [Cellvibrionales bacterium]
MLDRNPRDFFYLLSGQALALFGCSLTGFALGIYAYQENGSTTIYTAIALANILPIFLLSPLAGAIVDKFSRKWVLALANLGSIGVVGLLYFLHENQWLTSANIIGLVSLNATIAAFVLPTLSASIPLMVSDDQLSKANGLIAMGLGLIELVTPALSGTLYTEAGLDVIILANAFILFVALGVVSLCHIPRPTIPAEHTKEAPQQTPLLATLKQTANFLWKNPHFSRLIVFYAITVSLTMSMAILVQPMLLSITDAKTMGMTLSFASFGIIIGSLFMVVIPQVTKHIPVMLAMAAIVGVSCILIPLATSPMWIALGGFLVMCCYPIFDTNSRTLFQRKIEPHMLGRVIGIRNFILGSTQAICFIIVGPISDKLFAPAMAESGWLTPYLQSLYGIGEGRGVAVLISAIGCLLLIWVIISSFSRRLRSIDSLEDTLSNNDTKATNLTPAV